MGLQKDKMGLQSGLWAFRTALWEVWRLEAARRCLHFGRHDFKSWRLVKDNGSLLDTIPAESLEVTGG